MARVNFHTHVKGESGEKFVSFSFEEEGGGGEVVVLQRGWGGGVK